MQKLQFLSPNFNKNAKMGVSKTSTEKSKGAMSKILPDKWKPSKRRNSIAIHSRHAEDLIVTPFAQILVSLRSVRNNYVTLTNISPKDRSVTTLF